MMKKVILLLLLGFGLLGNSLYSQEKTITGTVTDYTDGSTLPGVNIVIKGTTVGTITDSDGNYEIRASEGDVLVFTFVGMNKEEVVVDERDVIDVAMMPDIEMLDEFIVIVSSVARDRETPVAVSTVSSEDIREKLGTQEFPQILQSTPSVYATREAGGFGDGRINLRGFDSNNIGVLINGVPVNDMENGRVYWSNWAGLSDVTQQMQVQRGLGASRLAISSVGGTINIVTQSTDAEKGGTLFYGIGHDGYQNQSLSLSTGKLDNGWAVTALGGRRTGEGFVQGAEFEGWSYFLNISKEINDQHTLSFTGFGAPQWHNQRWPRQLIQTYRDHPEGIRYNPSVGILNDEKYNASFNQYHKPQLSLNHYWSVTPATTLSTAVYASISSGGGRRIVGPQNNWLQFDREDGLPTDATKVTPDGFLDFDAVVAENAESDQGSLAAVGMAVNAHDWYGALSTLQTEIDNFRITGGLDLRYYKGYHYQEITNLLGGTHFQDVSIGTRLNLDGETVDTVLSNNVNRDPSARLQVGDKINYYNLGEVMWGGLFAQGEYITDEYSVFLSATLSNSQYRRTDYFDYFDDDSPKRKEFQQRADEYYEMAQTAQNEGDTEAYEEYMDMYDYIMGNNAMMDQQTDWVDFFAWSVKGGANYNITENHNVFGNAGYFTRAPFFRWAFQGFTNVVNEGVKHERVFSSEVGYGYRSPLLAANFIVYRTEWLDRALVQRVGDLTANMTGLNALHQGIELDFELRPMDGLRITGMFSYGDWKWQDDLVAEIYDDQQELQGEVEVYAGGLRVGNSAQTTAALGVSYEVLPNLRVGIDANHFDRLYADFNVEDRGDPDHRGIDSWQMPSYQIVDANLRYRFKIAGLDATFIANVNNLFDTEAIRDATDGRTFDHRTATVYYGWGRSWTTSIRLNF